MSKAQKYLFRDVMQALNINVLLTSLLVKTNRSPASIWYWQVFNTYLIEIAGTFFAFTAFANNSFKPAGLISVLIFISFSIIWLYYWLFL